MPFLRILPLQCQVESALEDLENGVRLEAGGLRCPSKL
jgi:hypothetical protein